LIRDVRDADADADAIARCDELTSRENIVATGACDVLRAPRRDVENASHVDDERHRLTIDETREIRCDMNRVTAWR